MSRHVDLICPPPYPGKEWMLSNGMGGYASGAVAGGVSRRHDGILVAALDYPRGRTVMVDWLQEWVLLPDGPRLLDDCPLDFSLQDGLPVWRYSTPGGVLERRVVMPHGQNTTHILYRWLDGVGHRLRIRPWMHCRHADWGVDQPLGQLTHQIEVDHIQLTMGDWPMVRLSMAGAEYTVDPQQMEKHYPVETERDFTDRGPVLSPLFLTGPQAAEIAMVISSDDWLTANALTGAQSLAAEQERRRRLLHQARPWIAPHPMADQMVWAADAFVFQPRNRPVFAAQARAEGDQVYSIIAGYPWFNDWGRDTMISLEGLTLKTGRAEQAKWIVRTFARCLQDGLIPDNIPDGPWPPVYHTADATLWFFHALDRYVRASQDWDTLDLLLPKFVQSLEAHCQGTLFGIVMDPKDGLLRASAPGYQLTWMDAIVGDWVVTPRRGKPVEINALWYNALRVCAGWLRQRGQAAQADHWDAMADRAAASFNQKFWAADLGYLYDVIDGDAAESPLCRPNQIFALSLPHAVLSPDRWAAVLGVVRDHLLTPCGLRSLRPGTPGYQAKFCGGQLTRDGAYHQGTVWPWMIGAYVDGWMRVAPQDAPRARDYLLSMAPLLTGYCQGFVGEVFDADPPHHPRGCTAQAWSVAEWLRAWSVVNDPVLNPG